MRRRYFVWPTNEEGLVVGNPHGPLLLGAAERYARARAIEHVYDRTVSVGDRPTADEFKIVSVYEARTGKKIV